jgi:D-tagatose-1,6-bisphosphate aldolase subunit GatZ/KbaZ
MSALEIREQLGLTGEGGVRAGIWSCCSANRFVLEAAMEQAAADDAPVLVESTSNQVNPEGGYTGQTPAAFAAFVKDVARSQGFRWERVLLGGDHLGPHPYRALPAADAMAKARDLVRQCVLAGYGKIHLDASMRLGGDPGAADTPVDPEVVTERAADLCAAAEEAHARLPAGAPAPAYVIGTDVPPPGGETAGAGPPSPTSRDDAERTVRLSRQAFGRRGLEAAWERVVAVVVQPGVEFSDTRVFDYDRDRSAALRDLIRGLPGLVFEAHSTDYQRPHCLRAMVEDRFAILKVGPWLTFAFREAVLALEALETEWLGGRAGVTLSAVRRVLDGAMEAQPEHWRGHHQGTVEEVRALRTFGFSDRVRYYWPAPEVGASVARLLANLRAMPAPLPLVSQHLPLQYDAIRAGEIPATPEGIVRHKIREVTRVYGRACARPEGARECG